MKKLLNDLKFKEKDVTIFLRLLHGEQSLKQLEVGLHLRQPEVSSAVSRLEKRGLAIKRLLPLPKRLDKRPKGRPEKIISIEPKGLVALIATAEHLLGDYDKDIQRLKSYLIKFKTG